MAYEILFAKRAFDQFGKLEKDVREKIADKLETICDDPFKHVRKLHGFNLYRLRVGDYRVIMSIEKGKLIVFVLEVGHRNTVYRKY